MQQQQHVQSLLQSPPPAFSAGTTSLLGSSSAPVSLSTASFDLSAQFASQQQSHPPVSMMNVNGTNNALPLVGSSATGGVETGAGSSKRGRWSSSLEDPLAFPNTFAATSMSSTTSSTPRHYSNRLAAFAPASSSAPQASTGTSIGKKRERSQSPNSSLQRDQQHLQLQRERDQLRDEVQHLRERKEREAAARDKEMRDMRERDKDREVMILQLTRELRDKERDLQHERNLNTQHHQQQQEREREQRSKAASSGKATGGGLGEHYALLPVHELVHQHHWPAIPAQKLPPLPLLSSASVTAGDEVRHAEKQRY